MSESAIAIKQIKHMLGMQDAMNNRISDTWREDNYEWYRAIWVECAEMLDHHGWKWWKHQQCDVAQVQLELVDIFHFGLALCLMNEDDIERIAEQLAEQMNQPSEHTDFKLALEQLSGAALTNKAFDGVSFAACMRLMDMDLDELFRQYVGKNTLNFFRQDHGYKAGTYIKVWHGKEDNEVLAELISSLDTSSDDFQSNVYQGLKDAYPA
ncbi:dUTP diphosphatase [Thalassotalea ponticola]|uniref:dUTP diphosphatase n=1 Tax=Thalassotalea ponticola TaxID=1523392 RepID=UPI00352823A0